MLADAGVGAGEGVLAVAEGADPGPGLVVHAGIGVQDGAALGAGADERVVREEGEVGELHQRRAHDRERDHKGSGPRFGHRPCVPRPPEALDRF